MAGTLEERRRARDLKLAYLRSESVLRDAIYCHSAEIDVGEQMQDMKVDLQVDLSLSLEVDGN
jgi:hypothetical protein